MPIDLPPNANPEQMAAAALSLRRRPTLTRPVFVNDDPDRYWRVVPRRRRPAHGGPR